MKHRNPRKNRNKAKRNEKAYTERWEPDSIGGYATCQRQHHQLNRISTATPPPPPRDAWLRPHSAKTGPETFLVSVQMLTNREDTTPVQDCAMHAVS